MAVIRTPVADYNGDVSGVTFVKGRGETNDPAALAYFRRHGYIIDGANQADDEVPPDPRYVGEASGGKLRDAAVDPRPGDFLPPSNAGEPGPDGNPHGPNVVSPEIHGSQGLRPVKPGPVSNAAPAQEVGETAHAEASVGNDPTAPPRNGSKAAWVEFAIAMGGDPDTVGAMSRDELADAFGTEET